MTHLHGYLLFVPDEAWAGWLVEGGAWEKYQPAMPVRATFCQERSTERGLFPVARMHHLARTDIRSACTKSYSRACDRRLQDSWARLRIPRRRFSNSGARAMHMAGLTAVPRVDSPVPYWKMRRGAAPEATIGSGTPISAGEGY
jgi:hypothetical protein